MSTSKPIIDSLNEIVSSNGDTISLNSVCKFEAPDTNMNPLYHLWKVNNQEQDIYQSNFYYTSLIHLEHTQYVQKSNW